MAIQNQNKNECYDSDCHERVCLNPEHYNYICMDPNCDNIHCKNNKHYNKQLLEKFQKEHGFTPKKHIKPDPNAEFKICNCGDCQEEEEHHHHHEHDHCDCEHEHHHHHHEHDHCDCEHEHHHHHHEHHHEGEKCSCCEDDDISICNCGDCNDNKHEDVIQEGIPLLKNRAIQIIVSSGILFGAGIILEHTGFGQIASILFVLTAIISGYDIAKIAKNSILKRYEVSPAVLVCIAAVSAFLIGYPEEAAAVTFLYFVAEFLEDYSELRAKHSIKSLVEIAPETALVKQGTQEVQMPVEQVPLDTITIIKPGEKIPLDGIVVKGTSSIDQAAITGESIPVLKTEGDKVFSGTVNEDGFLEVIVTKESKDSVISKIVTLVKTSQQNRSKTETTVEKIAKYYTPVMIVITILVAVVPPLVFGDPFTDWIYRALSLMVISCPCAFLISTPIGMVSAITSATRKGVLIKGSSYVEEMRHIKAIIFDKTGTLTEGKLEVVDIDLLSDKYTHEDMLKIAASLETKSSHPIANAIIKEAKNRNLDILEIENFKNVAGKGIVGYIDDIQYYSANESLIEGGNFNITDKNVLKHTKEGKTVVYVGNKDEVIGIITVIDKIRDETHDVIANLKKQGIETIMLTGDNKIAAQSVANKIGIDYVYSHLLPEDKINILDTIRNKFGDVAMVGDGVNDAPALARANVGIAMGAVGSDVAIETADVALMQDDLSKLPYLFTLSNKTMSIIKENIITALSVKFLFVILAILGLITLMMAVGFGDLGLTLLVIFNSFRIGIVKDPIF